jgi:hypothetical protein
MYRVSSLVSELAREARKKTVRRRTRLREGLVRRERMVLRRVVVRDLRPGVVVARGVGRSGSVVAEPSSSEEEKGTGWWWWWVGVDGGREEMTGMARMSRAMPIQNGSQSRVLMVAEARAGPSWSEKTEETALT